MPLPLCIVKVGDAVEEVVARRGDYDLWFRELLGESEASSTVVDPRRGESLPSPGSVAGVVVTGSSSMVSDREAWSERTGAWLREVVAAGRPILGVCYGHQLLAHALGGEVGKNPNGREIGTVEVETTPAARADRLFGSLPPTLQVQATHRESVLSLPAGAVLLGGNRLDPHQAYRVGERVWCVQFHPEMDADIIRGYIAARAGALATEGLDAARLDRDAHDSDDGRALLARFASIVREPSGGRG